MGLDHQLSLAAAQFGAAYPELVAWCQKLGSLYGFKTAPFIAVLVALWFSRIVDGRRAVLSGIAGTFVALVIARIIQNVGPHRPRPVHRGDMPFLEGAATPPDWSSFPSDTAACIGALVIAIWLASRPLGIAALIWSVAVLAISKFIVGAHYLSDLVAGFAIGGISCWLCYVCLGKWSAPSRFFETCRQHYPALTAGLMFLVLYQLATFFDDVRVVGRGVLDSAGIVRESEPPVPNRDADSFASVEASLP